MSSHLLGPAVAAARRALRLMDDDDVPAPLRRIAGSSARRLPPPMEARLLEELTASQWLREEALAHLENTEAGVRPALEVSGLFLRRPEGWEGRIAEIDRAEAARQEERAAEDIRRENASLRRRLDEAERALVRERNESRARKQPEAGVREEDLERLRRRMGELWSEIARRDEMREELEAELAGVLDELAEADIRISELRDALLRSRRRASQGKVEGGAGRAFGRGSATEIARALDQLHSALTPGRPAVVEPVAGVEGALPNEIRPDRAEAIDWLIRRPTSTTLLVDGYNVAHELAGGPDARTRTRLAHELGRIRRLAEAPIRPVLFWDTSMEPDRWSVAGVDVRYVPSADDAIVEEAGASASVVVVTGDREVRERSAERGAICLWGQALSEWVAR